jgi:hypothetical protein
MKRTSRVLDIYEMKTMGKTFAIIFLCLNEPRFLCIPIEWLNMRYWASRKSLAQGASR